MTAISQLPPRIQSAALAKPLHTVALRRWRLRATKGTLQTLTLGLAVALPPVLLLGFWSSPSGIVRWPVALVAWAGVAAVAAWRLGPALRRLDLLDAAFDVEQKLSIPERVSSAVQLTRSSGASSDSPDLLAHLVAQAERDVARVDAVALEPLRPTVLPWGVGLALLLAVWIAAVSIWPRPVACGVYRLLMPWRGGVPALLADISVKPGDVRLPTGDPLHVSAVVHRNGVDDAGATLVARRPSGEVVEHTMGHDAGKNFSFHLPEVTERFEYQVRAAGVESPWYAVTIAQRPTATLDVHYEYPAYTGLPPMDQPQSSGALSGVVGTQATLMLRCNVSLDLAASQISLNEGRRDEAKLPLTLVAGSQTDYRVLIPLRTSGSYRIKLFSAEGVAGRDDAPRPIEAIEDREPTIAITAPKSTIRLRPDDAVDVRYQASDDFGVATLQALAAVDDQPEKAMAIDLSRVADRRKLEGAWRLSAAEIIAKSGAKPEEARSITYRLRVVDNRDPDPHARETRKQTIEIDRGQEMFALRDARQRLQTLQEAIRRTIDRLNESEPQANDLRQINRDRDADEGWRRDAAERATHAADQMAQAGKALAEAAKEERSGPMQQTAAEAAEVAAGPLQRAADAMGAAALAVTDSAARSSSARESQRQIAEARKRLESLLQAAEKEANRAEAAAAIQNAAERQQALADAIAEHQAAHPPANPDQRPELTPEQRQAQQELLNQVEQAVGHDESLRNQQAASLTQRLNELLDRVGQTQQDQQRVARRTQKQNDALRAQDQLNDLAKRQRELNDRVREFAQKSRDALRRAEANPPNDDQMQGIVRELQQGDPRRGAELQQEAAKSLHEAAQRLEQSADRNELRDNEADRLRLEQAQRNIERADQIAEATRQAAERLRQLKQDDNTPPAAKKEAAVQLKPQTDELAKQARQAVEQAQKAGETAAALERDAEADRAAADRDPQQAAADGQPRKQPIDAEAARAARESAEKAVQAAAKATQAAEEAQEAAKDGDASAGEKAVQAAQALQDSRRQTAEAMKRSAVAAQRSGAADAASDAADLAEKQSALAELTKPAAEAALAARQDAADSRETAENEARIAQQLAESEKLADKLNRRAGDAAADLAERGDAARGDLDQAGAAAEKAAEASRQASERRELLNEARQREAEHLNQARQAAQQLAEAQERAARIAAQAEAAKAAGDDGGGNQLEKEHRKADRDAQNAQRREGEARRQAQEAVRRADATLDAIRKAQELTAAQQRLALKALAKAATSLRGLPEPKQDEGDKGQDAQAAKDGDAQASGENGKGEAASADAKAVQGAKGQPQNEGGDGQPQPADAARATQEALLAQRQALQNVPLAPRQAAAALARAASAMARQSPGGQDQTPSNAAAQANSNNGQSQQKGNDPSNSMGQMSGMTFDSRQGTSLGGGTSNAAPESVRAMGVAPGDWARLPPKAQQDLLNASQRGGPPAYREMIKNYYLRIARLPVDEPKGER